MVLIFYFGSARRRNSAGRLFRIVLGVSAGIPGCSFNSHAARSVASAVREFLQSPFALRRSNSAKTNMLASWPPSCARSFAPAQPSVQLLFRKKQPMLCVPSEYLWRRVKFGEWPEYWCVDSCYNDRVRWNSSARKPLFPLLIAESLQILTWHPANFPIVLSRHLNIDP
jgi:hypothetical protein